MTTAQRCAALLLAVGAGTALGLTGCSNTQARPEWIRMLTFWEKAEIDPRGELAPYKRLAALRETKKKLPDMPQAEQQALATKWADEYRVETDPLLKAQLVRSIAYCGSPVAFEVLQEATRDSDREIRIAACDAWVTHGGPQMVPHLSQLWRTDPALDVRLAAGRSLGKAQGPEVVQALAAGLEDPNPSIQYRAVFSLRETTGKDFGDDANAWREFIGGGEPKEISTARRMKLEYF
jgi:hypothetical protein